MRERQIERERDRDREATFVSAPHSGLFKEKCTGGEEESVCMRGPRNGPTVGS